MTPHVHLRPEVMNTTNDMIPQGWGGVRDLPVTRTTQGALASMWIVPKEARHLLEQPFCIVLVQHGPTVSMSIKPVTLTKERDA